MGRMTSLPSDPLSNTDWLLVDGNNLLHALTTSKHAAPRSALIGRLRGAVPISVAIDVVFDGPSESNLRGERIASGLRVRYSGARTADAVILSLVEEVRLVDGPAATDGVLVVTNDSDLRRRLHGRGARTAGTNWLLGRLDRDPRRKPSAVTRPPRPTKASTRPPAGSTTDADPDGDDADEPRWEPGRHATVKKGNPRRRPKSGGTGGG